MQQRSTLSAVGTIDAQRRRERGRGKEEERAGPKAGKGSESGETGPLKLYPRSGDTVFQEQNMAGYRADLAGYVGAEEGY